MSSNAVTEVWHIRKNCIFLIAAGVAVPPFPSIQAADASRTWFARTIAVVRADAPWWIKARVCLRFWRVWMMR
jgi:hypothetical protein